MKTGLAQRKNALVGDLRKLADLRARDGVFDKQDVEALLKRAGADGTVTKAEAEDLSFVRERYDDIMDVEAASFLDNFLSTWIADEMARAQRKRAKEKEGEKKAEAQIEKIEVQLDQLRDWREKVDQRLRDLQVDDKQRVLLTNFFNLKR